MKQSRYRKAGWFNESARHSLAAKGVKTGRKSKCSGYSLLGADGTVSISEARRKNESSGRHFFDASSMRFFDSRVETKGDLHKGKYFITSEQFHGSDGSLPRKYTIRELKSDGSIGTVGEFNKINSLSQAKEKMSTLSAIGKIRKGKRTNESKFWDEMHGSEILYKDIGYVGVEYPYIISSGKKIKLSSKEWKNLYDDYFSNPNQEGYWLMKDLEEEFGKE